MHCKAVIHVIYENPREVTILSKIIHYYTMVYTWPCSAEHFYTIRCRVVVAVPCQV